MGEQRCRESGAAIQQESSHNHIALCKPLVVSSASAPHLFHHASCPGSCVGAAAVAQNCLHNTNCTSRSRFTMQAIPTQLRPRNCGVDRSRRAGPGQHACRRAHRSCRVYTSAQNGPDDSKGEVAIVTRLALFAHHAMVCRNNASRRAHARSGAQAARRPPARTGSRAP